jgi:hypothetical protein
MCCRYIVVTTCILIVIRSCNMQAAGFDVWEKSEPDIIKDNSTSGGLPVSILYSLFSDL